MSHSGGLAEEARLLPPSRLSPASLLRPKWPEWPKQRQQQSKAANPFILPANHNRAAAECSSDSQGGRGRQRHGPRTADRPEGGKHAREMRARPTTTQATRAVVVAHLFVVVVVVVLVCFENEAASCTPGGRQWPAETVARRRRKKPSAPPSPLQLRWRARPVAIRLQQQPAVFLAAAAASTAACCVLIAVAKCSTSDGINPRASCLHCSPGWLAGP